MAETAIYIDARERILSDAALGLPGRHTDGSIPRVLYVSKGGTDGNPGTRTYPLLTIQAAVNRAVDGRGDMILVGQGNFDEDVTVSKSNLWIRGTSLKSEIRGNGVTGGAAIRVADEGIPGFRLSNLAVRSNHANKPSLHLDNNNNDGSAPGGFVIEDCHIGAAVGSVDIGILVVGCIIGQIKRCWFASSSMVFGIGFRGGLSVFPQGIQVEDCIFAGGATANVVSFSSGLTPGAANLDRVQFQRCYFNSTTVTDYINFAGAMTNVHFFDCWFSRVAADGGTLELPAGVVVLGRDPAGLVNVTGV